MKKHFHQFAIIISKAHGDTIWAVNTSYAKIVEEFKKLKESNPNINAWVQEIIG